MAHDQKIKDNQVRQATYQIIVEQLQKRGMPSEIYPGVKSFQKASYICVCHGSLYITLNEDETIVELTRYYMTEENLIREFEIRDPNCFDELITAIENVL